MQFIWRPVRLSHPSTQIFFCSSLRPCVKHRGRGEKQKKKGNLRKYQTEQEAESKGGDTAITQRRLLYVPSVYIQGYNMFMEIITSIWRWFLRGSNTLMWFASERQINDSSLHVKFYPGQRIFLLHNVCCNQIPLISTVGGCVSKYGLLFQSTVEFIILWSATDTSYSATVPSHTEMIWNPGGWLAITSSETNLRIFKK